MKTSTNHPPHLAVVFSALGRNIVRNTRQQHKHDMLLNFMAQLNQPSPKPVKVKPKKAFLRSLLSVFL